MQLTRREFLIAAGAVACSATSRGSSLPRVIHAGTRNPKALERSLLTFCRQCPGGCGLRIRVVNDCVVGISGNPWHPINRGGVCARAPASVQTLYNPDRLSTPLALAGPKGAGRYRPIDREKAVALLAARLRSTRHNPGAHSLAVVINGDRGLRRILWSRFLQAYGSNNLIDWSPAEGHSVYPFVRAAQGFQGGIGYDLERAQYVLSFGSQWLDAHWSPAQASAAFATLRSRRQVGRSKVVHVEPRLSVTGAKANEWIPVRPGTEGALALGLAHVLVREGLYDQEFVQKYTHGFDEPQGGGGERIGYRRLVLRDYTPSRVERVTGVDEGTIFRLAREFASVKPAVAVGFDGSGVSAQRCHDRMAIHSLNALVGSIDVPGGVSHFEDVELLNLPVPQPDELAERGLSRPRIDSADPADYPLGDDAPQVVAERVLVGLPYDIDTLVLAGGDPVFESPQPERMKQALAEIPFVVSLSPWMDESTLWADLIIPDTHFLARWDLDVGHTLTGQPTVTIGRPVVSSSGDLTLDSAELILELARRLGEPVVSAVPFRSAEHVVRVCCEGLYSFGRGGPFGPEKEQEWIRVLERGGWRFPVAASADEFYRQLLASGGWTDPIYRHREWDRVFRNPARRFGFYSTVIAARVRPTNAEGDIRCLPHYEEPQARESDSAFPLSLYVYPLSTLAGLADANVPWLMDACGAYMSTRWESWVEINPETAHKLEIEDGDTVVVTSSRGKIRAQARLFQGIIPDVVAMPWGLGHQSGGRWCKGIGQNPSSLVETQTDPLTSGKFWNATRVSIQKA